MSKLDPQSRLHKIAARIREAGQRASAEAEERRMGDPTPAARDREIGGTNGPEPTRFGDWERKGLISDF